jgi:uncharacterized membrane protein YfcA
VLLAALCVGGASVVGGATGFGTALIATPLLLLAGLGVPQVVVINLLVALVTRIAVVYQLRDHVTWRRVAALGLASIPGACLGAAIVGVLPSRWLKLAVGVLVVLAGLRLALPSRGARPASAVRLSAAGLAGGFLGTTTSLNGPPPVLVLSRARLPRRAFVADLAGYFVVTNTLSLAILALGGTATSTALWPLLPVCVVTGVAANAAGLRIGHRLPARMFRSAVIALVVAAGIVTAATA